MTGAQFKAIRNKLDLSVIQMGRAIGYSGNNNTISVTIRQMELGTRPVPFYIARLMLMFALFGVPERFLSS